MIPITNSDRLAMLGPLPNPKTLTIASWFRRHIVFQVVMICACYSRCELDSSMCSTVGGVYQSTRDLLQLEAVTSVPLVEGVSVEGVLPFPICDHYLCSHPDRDYADFLRMGIRWGFKIGLDCSHKLKPPKRNYESSTDNLGHAQRYINGEMVAMRHRRVPFNAQVHLESYRSGSKGPPAREIPINH